MINTIIKKFKYLTEKLSATDIPKQKIQLNGNDLIRISSLSKSLKDYYQKLGELELAFELEKEKLLSEAKDQFKLYTKAVEELVQKNGGDLSTNSKEVWEFNPNKMTLEQKN